MPNFFRNRLSALSSDEASLDRLWKKIETAWSEPHRYYHTLDHLEHCLKIAGDVEHEFLLALYFHDAIYDPLRDDNEAASAALVRPWLTECDIIADIETVERLILATEHRQPPTRKDERRIVDIDLAILGSDETMYHNYVKNVRREYTHVNEKDWRNGRAKVLRSFLQRDSIFSTAMGRTLNEPARKNLSQELNQLISNIS